jgi:hypothetical protein
MLRPEVVRALLLLLALSSTGCGLLFQTIAGWREDESSVEVRKRPLEIDTDPDGAMVIREGPDGTAAIGRGPVVDSVPYQVEVITSAPRIGTFLAGLGVDVLVSAAVLTYCAIDDLCGLRFGLPFAVTVLGAEGTFLLLASRREDQIREEEVASPSFQYWAVSGTQRSSRVAVSGSSPSGIDLSITGAGSTPLRFPRGTTVSIVVSGAIGATASSALFLAALDESVQRAVLDLGYQVSPPGFEPVPLRVIVEPSEDHCVVRATIGASPVLAQAERSGSCRDPALPDRIAAMIAELFEP